MVNIIIDGIAAYKLIFGIAVSKISWVLHGRWVRMTFPSASFTTGHWSLTPGSQFPEVFAVLSPDTSIRKSNRMHSSEPRMRGSRTGSEVNSPDQHYGFISRIWLVLSANAMLPPKVNLPPALLMTRFALRENSQPSFFIEPSFTTGRLEKPEEVGMG